MRHDGNQHISIYPIGNHKFAAKWFDRTTPYTLNEDSPGKFKFFLDFLKKKQVIQFKELINEKGEGLGNVEKR